MTGLIVASAGIKDNLFYKKYYEEADLIISADGGGIHLKEIGVTPHILLGDFDSINPETLEGFRKEGIEILKFPVEKNMTDSELAIDLAIEKGCKKLIMIGVLGGPRIDHELSNIFLLRKMLSAGVEGVLVDEKNEIRITDSSITIDREPKSKLTIISLTEKSLGVSTKGLYYPLLNEDIYMGSSYGVSNEFVEDKAEVSVRDGILLVIKSKD